MLGKDNVLMKQIPRLADLSGYLLEGTLDIQQSPVPGHSQGGMYPRLFTFCYRYIFSIRRFLWGNDSSTWIVSEHAFASSPNLRCTTQEAQVKTDL